MNRGQQLDGGRYVPVGVLVIAIVTMAVVGGTVMDKMEERHEQQLDRADEVYGSDYLVVSSSACWDMCAPTATTRDQQAEDMLYTLKRRGGWVSEFQLMDSTAGYDLDAAGASLVYQGLVERRTVSRLGVTSYEYRYVGPETDTETLADEEVTERVQTRLYLTGTMTAEEIASDLPVGTYRVRNALAQLEREGAVDSGYVNQGGFAFVSERHYIDTRRGTLPDSWWRGSGLLGPFVFVVITVVAIALIQRLRHQPSPNE